MKILRGRQLLEVKMKEVAKMRKILGKWFRMPRETDGKRIQLCYLDFLYNEFLYNEISS